MKTAIIYPNFLTPDGSERRIGGVETYLWQLSRLIRDRGGTPVLLQAASRPFQRQVEHLTVVGLVPGRRFGRSTLHADLYRRARALVAGDGGTIIFGADHASVPAAYPRAVSIQHGIGWDLPARFYTNGVSRLPGVSQAHSKRYVAWRSRRYFEHCPNRVCVDYNFPNWYRLRPTLTTRAAPGRSPTSLICRKATSPISSATRVRRSLCSSRDASSSIAARELWLRRRNHSSAHSIG